MTHDIIRPLRGALRWTGAMTVAAAVGACGVEPPDAYGNFEAIEVAVSPEFSAPLVRMVAEEGQPLAAGTVVAELDTVPLSLQRRELRGQQDVARLRAEEAEAQVEVLRAQLVTARDDLARTQRLFDLEAATAQDLTRADGAVRVLDEQITAARARVRLARGEANTFETRIAQIVDRMARSRIVNPIAGTVLTRFAETGEFVQAGRPLYTIARLDTLTLRAWVSGAQLADLKLGDEVEVRIDAGRDALHVLTGRVTWIAAVAEFTPTPIQTREERVDQVYAVKVRVPNPDGVVKIGMPGELIRPVPGATGGSES